MAGRAGAALLALGASAVLAGCGGNTDGGQPPPPTAASSARVDSPPLDAEAGAAGGPTAASPTWDPRVEQLAAAAAEGAVTAFVREDLDPPSWAARLSPLLSQLAQMDYLGPDPANPATVPDNVPGSQVTGPVTVSQGPSPALAAVIVPTDAGDYVVLLSRDADSELPNPWLVERFQLPEDP